MSTDAVTRELAAALGVSHARRAVLTLEVGQLPHLAVEVLPTVRPPQTIGAAIDPQRVAAVPFVMRLERSKT